MLFCKKTYSDIPFAHRQHKHPGHCHLLHGHNWGISLTFGCHETDECGFVVDFGRLKFLKQWIDDHLDHACVIADDDEAGKKLVESAPGLFKVYHLPNTSSEGLAEHIYTLFNKMVREDTDDRAFIVEVEIIEDGKNSAIYRSE